MYFKVVSRTVSKDIRRVSRRFLGFVLGCFMKVSASFDGG